MRQHKIKDIFQKNMRNFQIPVPALLFFLLLINLGGGCKKCGNCAGPGPSQDSIPVSDDMPDTTGYTLVWSDEFNYTGLPDSTKWGYDVGNGTDGWGNQELEYYTSDSLSNARVENGYLIIEARKQQINGFNYTSARLVTREKAEWEYGKIVVRAKLPSGRGTWPAIWMLGGEQPLVWPNDGEIDIMEEVGFQPGIIHGSVYTESFNWALNTPQTNSVTIPDTQDSFHLYSLVWTPELINIYADTLKIITFYNQNNSFAAWPFNNNCYLLLNDAIGGNWGGQEGVDTTIFPQDMVIDYVRVYQKQP